MPSVVSCETRSERTRGSARRSETYPFLSLRAARRELARVDDAAQALIKRRLGGPPSVGSLGRLCVSDAEERGELGGFVEEAAVGGVREIHDQVSRPCDYREGSKERR